MPSFLQTTREERFFCAVLLHVLLTPSRSQAGVLSIMNAAAGGPPLSAADLEAFVEVAALRDAWRALGDPNKYTPMLHAARLEVLHGLLRAACGFTGDKREFDALIQQHDFFWSTPKKVKLHSPGRWPLEGLQSAANVAPYALLRSLKWAFNAKPDFLLLSSGHGLLVEAKAASPFGANHKTGYDQESVQDLIAKLFPIFTRGLVIAPLRRITITNVAHGTGNLTWSEILSVVDSAEIGAFSHAALERAAAVLN